MISERDIRYILKCLEYCRVRNSGGQYRLASLFVYSKKRYIGPYLNNYYKSEPLSLIKGKDYLLTLHAEVKLIKELNKLDISSRDIKKGTLYISGLSPSNKIITSKPCEDCLTVISQTLISRCVYTIRNPSHSLILQECFIKELSNVYKKS